MALELAWGGILRATSMDVHPLLPPHPYSDFSKRLTNADEDCWVGGTKATHQVRMAVWNYSQLLSFYVHGLLTQNPPLKTFISEQTFQFVSDPLLSRL
jgi:hypothetical protein